MSRKLKIAFVITRSHDIGGAQIHVRDLSAALDARGHDATVLAGDRGVLAEQVRQRGVDYVRLEHLVKPVRPVQDLQAFRELRRVLKRLSPDVVSTHTSKAGALGRLAARSLGIPTVHTAHGFGFTAGRPLLQRLGFWLSDRLLSGFTGRLIAVCEKDRREAIRLRVAKPDSIVTIHNAMPDLPPESRADPGAEPATLVMVARFVDEKDHGTLLRALDGLGELEWRLELVGDGPLRDDVEELASTLPGTRSRVEFLGFREDVPAILSRAQIYVLSSTWEGFPRSILEAMRAGLPVVATDVGGVSEAVTDGVTGYVVPPGSVSTLQARLHQLIVSGEQRKRMGEASRRRFEEKFTFPQLVRRTVRLYESLLSER